MKQRGIGWYQSRFGSILWMCKQKDWGLTAALPHTHTRVAPEGSRFLSVYHHIASVSHRSHSAEVWKWSVVTLKVFRFSCIAAKKKTMAWGVQWKSCKRVTTGGQSRTVLGGIAGENGGEILLCRLRKLHVHTVACNRERGVRFIIISCWNNFIRDGAF